MACITTVFILISFLFCNGGVIIQNGASTSPQNVTLYLNLPSISNANCSDKWITDVFIFNHQIDNWVYPTDYTHGTDHRDKYIWDCTQSGPSTLSDINNCSFYLPISIKLGTNEQPSGDPMLLLNVIQDFNSNSSFITECNLCTHGSQTCDSLEPTSSMELETMTTGTTSTEDSYKYLSYAVVALFAMVAVAGFIDAKYVRKNDFFHLGAIFSAMIQISDMFSDLFFAAAVWEHYTLHNEHEIKYVIIFCGSILFIIIPVGISLYQLHIASSKHWLKENKTREWLMKYGKFLYLSSVITGSSFSAVSIFNSNLFDLGIFDLGLNRKHLMSWNTKRVYSVILFENLPQLLLSLWFTFIIGELTYIPAAQMTFSIVSIITTIMAMFLQKKIYFTQDFVYITIDIKGQCVTENLTMVKRKINSVKTYVSEAVLGVNKDSVDFDKPINISQGVQLRIHITYIHDNSEIDPANHYNGLLQQAVGKGKLQQIVKDEWDLASLPFAGNIKCVFQRSKEKRQNERGPKLEDTKEMKQRSIEINETIDFKRSRYNSNLV